jgi:hypothetical protein
MDLDPDPFLPAAPSAAGAQDIVDAAVIAVELRAHQLAVAEAQLLEMAVQGREVLVVEVALQRLQQGGEPCGGELGGVIVGDLA